MSIESRSIRTVIGPNARLLALLAVIVVCRAAGPPARVAAQAEPQSDSGLRVLEIKPNFYMISGAGSNVAVHIGPDGVVVTDTGKAEMAGALLAAIKRLTQQGGNGRRAARRDQAADAAPDPIHHQHERRDRKSTRLNSSHVKISYAVFCLKKKKI